MTNMLWTAGSAGAGDEGGVLPGVVRAAASGPAGRPGSGDGRWPSIHRVLPRPLFLELLRRDRLRADRTDTPLALVTVKLNRHAQDDYASTVRAIDLLHAAMRESDALGFVDDECLMVLMPDTTEAGARNFVERVTSNSDWPALTPEVVPYPSVLLGQLQTGGASGPPVLPLLFAEPSQSKRWQMGLKRVMDVVGACVALTLFSPLMLATAVAVKLTSPGPVIFRQVRLGRGFAPFVFLKFRSMHDKADDKVHREQVSRLITDKAALADDSGDDKAFYKMKGDGRITRFGHLIRRTSIDELPQLINVLKNEMSLVGPRPPLPYETELYEPWHLRRVLEVKPGLTGLWQVEGRSEVSFDDMVRLDLRYSREWSVLMDVRILLKTIGVVLRCRGAA